MEEKFIELYNNPEYHVDDIKKELGLNNRQYSQLYNQLENKKRRVNYHNAKYTVKLKNGNLLMRKWIKKDKINLGVYSSQEDADKVTEICKKHNWDLNNPLVQETIEKHRIKPKNYKKIGERYYPCKYRNGERKYYDSFKSEKEAINAVKLLNHVDWNEKEYEKLKGEVL